MKRLAIIVAVLGIVAAACGQGEDPADVASPAAPAVAEPEPAATAPPATQPPTTDPATTQPPTTQPPTTQPPSSATTSPPPPAEAESPAAPVETTVAVEPLPPPFTGTTERVSGEGTGQGTVTRARLAAQEGFDRFVIEFKNTISEFEVMYVDGPFVDVPGNVVPVGGDVFLLVHLWHAAPYELIDEEPFYVPTYEGPTRLRSDTVNVDEVVITYMFENDMEWAIGLHQRQPFRVMTLGDPSRLVVDVLHGDAQRVAAAPEGWSWWASGQWAPPEDYRPAPVIAARLSAGNGFDRFVVEFGGDIVPAYDVLYTSTPFVACRYECGPVVAGEAHVFVDIHPATLETGHEDGSSTRTYLGPDRLTADTGNVVEVVLTAVDNWTQWIIGVDRRAPLRVFTLQDPPRLVIDVSL